MNRILKKTAVMIMAAAIGVSMNYQGAAVFAGTNNNITKQARYVEPEEWNRTEIKAYQFDSTDKFENYLLTISIGQTLSRLSPRATPCKQLSLHTAFHGISLYC